VTEHAVLDLFAGSGVGVACQQLGVTEYGVEKMPAAQETRRLNGMTTVYDDVWDIDKAEGLKFDTLWASPPCFTAGAPVVTKRGIVAIENVVVGDRVLTHMGRWRAVTDTMSREAETVTFGNITSTPDHPFYAATQWRKWDNESRRYRWGVGPAEWVDAKDTKGKFLSIPISSEGVRDVAVPSNLSWWLIGRWLADGWGQSKRGEICIAVGAGKEVEFESYAGQNWKPYQMRSVTRYVLHDRKAIEWLNSNFGSGAAGKTLPGEILGMEKIWRQHLLEGYLSGDGTKTRSGWNANTVSLNLATGIKLLAESLGFTTSLIHVETPATTIIEGRVVNQANYWSIRINENTGRYSRSDALHRWVKQRKDVVNSGRQVVYDITVEEDHSFVCWGYVVHNCQTFSVAGKGSGRKALNDVLTAIAERRWTSIQSLKRLGEEVGDERTALVLTPLTYVNRFRPTYIAFEQVPAVLPVWEACAAVMRDMGYSVWTGYLHAEQYGVPQTRKRAYLIARSDGKEAQPPAPTHSRYYSRNPEKLDLGVKKWVSMAEGLADAT